MLENLATWNGMSNTLFLERAATFSSPKQFSKCKTTPMDSFSLNMWCNTDFPLRKPYFQIRQYH